MIFPSKQNQLNARTSYWYCSWKVAFKKLPTERKQKHREMNRWTIEVGAGPTFSLSLSLLIPILHTPNHTQQTLNSSASSLLPFSATATTTTTTDGGDGDGGSENLLVPRVRHERVPDSPTLPSPLPSLPHPLPWTHGLPKPLPRKRRRIIPLRCRFSRRTLTPQP